MATGSNRVYREGKKWEDYLPNGEINPASYRFDNCNRVVRTATEIAIKESGMAKASEIKKISNVLMSVISDATHEHTDRVVEPQHAMWTNAWFSLLTWMEFNPFFESDDLDDWTKRAIRYVVFNLALTEQLATESFH